MKDAVPQEHKANAPVSVGCFVLTMSDSKTSETDTSGALIRELLTAAGHRVTGHAIVKDDPAQVTAVIRSGCAAPSVEAFILTGDGHHQPRLDLRGNRGAPRQAADRFRRALSHALVSGDRRGGHAVAGAGRSGPGAGPLLAAGLAQCLPAGPGEADHPRIAPFDPRGAPIGLPVYSKVVSFDPTRPTLEPRRGSTCRST